ncbi:MAG: HAD hydrolase-like protein, partial [Burkholderiales bacterium]
MEIMPAGIARARIIKPRKTGVKTVHQIPPASLTSKLAVESDSLTRARNFRMRFPCVSSAALLTKLRARHNACAMQQGPAPPLLVFDLDGTLADTAGDLVATLNVILAREGLAGIAAPDVRAMVGNGARALIQRGLSVHGIR